MSEVQDMIATAIQTELELGGDPKSCASHVINTLAGERYQVCPPLDREWVVRVATELGLASDIGPDGFIVEPVDEACRRVREILSGVDQTTAESLLMQFSEWLDVESNRIADDPGLVTHEDYVLTFLSERNADAQPKLVG